MTEPHPKRSRQTEGPEILDFIAVHWAEYGYAPSLQDIGKAFGMSRSTAMVIVHRMIEEGLLTQAPGTARTLRLTGAQMVERQESM
jgi:DNA-binding IclR family transcriptional regulator